MPATPQISPKGSPGLPTTARGVINMSFVMSGYDDGVAAALAHARSKGVLIVAAAGNDGSADVTFPAGQPGVVSVTGTDAADVRYQWASYGSWVTLAAPGLQPVDAGGRGVRGLLRHLVGGGVRVGDRRTRTLRRT